MVNSKGVTEYSGQVGALLGKWSHSKTVTYDVYALDFNVPGGDLYTISVSGPVRSCVASVLRWIGRMRFIPGLLLNTLFFYETQRDGANSSRTRCAPNPDT